MAMSDFLARRRAIVLSVATAAAITLAGTLAAGAQAPPPPYLKNFPNFAPLLTRMPAARSRYGGIPC
jgi:hypothetical protein